MIGPHRRARGLIVLLLALSLMTAACGTRWDHGQRVEIRDRYAAARSHSPAGSVGSGETSDTTPTGSSGAAAGDGSGAGSGSATGVTVPTAAGGSTGATSSGPLPCAAPSSAPGVTTDAITIGTVTSLSGPVPGLGTSSLAGVKAFAAYVDSQGGVCGRQVKVKTGDDGGDNAQARSVTTSMVPQVLGLVGGAAGGVAGSQDVIAQAKIPAVESTVSPNFVTGVPNVFGTNPPFPNLKAVVGKFKYLHDNGAKKAAIVYVDAQSAPEEINLRQKPLMEAAGIQVALVLPLPLTTLSYDSAARAVANSGADYLLFLHEAGASASMARAMADTGYKLKFAEYLTAYGSSFPQLAGSAAEGAISWIRSLPAEDKGRNPMLDAFLTWMARTAPGTPADSFAADGWAAAAAFFQGVAAEKGPIARDAVTAALAGIDTFDAGGFYGPIHLGPKRTEGCQIAMIYRGGHWTRLTPAQGFLC